MLRHSNWQVRSPQGFGEAIEFERRTVKTFDHANWAKRVEPAIPAAFGPICTGIAAIGKGRRPALS
ncbi:hypothetical protein [Gemmobacter caeni]|uniref:hypothetical protein n=1 Tax=Gemmobacter caeni TaxID=589035 RepID=UPI0011A9C933|nr:hypothetical protein [Gemmobacter caeni]